MCLGTESFCCNLWAQRQGGRQASKEDCPVNGSCKKMQKFSRVVSPLCAIGMVWQLAEEIVQVMFHSHLHRARHLVPEMVASPADGVGIICARRRRGKLSALRVNHPLCPFRAAEGADECNRVLRLRGSARVPAASAQRTVEAVICATSSAAARHRCGRQPSDGCGCPWRPQSPRRSRSPNKAPCACPFCLAGSPTVQPDGLGLTQAQAPGPELPTGGLWL